MRDRHRVEGWVTRVLLLALALPQLATGAFALFSPRGFYEEFPAAGRPWVAALGPYDEHLVRDVGAGLLALSVLLIFAAVSLDRGLIRAALVTWLVFAVPHLVFHVSATDSFGLADNVANLSGHGLAVLIPVGMLIGTRGPRRASSGPSGPT